MTTATFECRLDVFDATETRRYGTLRAAMKAAASEVRELADGYGIRLASDPELFKQVAEWITMERRCCPFLTLGVEWTDDDAVWVRLTGGPGVKTYLAGVLSSVA